MSVFEDMMVAVECKHHMCTAHTPAVHERCHVTTNVMRSTRSSISGGGGGGGGGRGRRCSIAVIVNALSIPFEQH